MDEVPKKIKIVEMENATPETPGWGRQVSNSIIDANTGVSNKNR
jgi:hypothetical protein